MKLDKRCLSTLTSKIQYITKYITFVHLKVDFRVKISMAKSEI